MNKRWSNKQTTDTFNGQHGDTAAKKNYYALLVELDEKEIENCEVSLVDSGLISFFNYTTKLHIIQYEEAINRSNCKLGNKKSRTNMSK